MAVGTFNRPILCEIGTKNAHWGSKVSISGGWGFELTGSSDERIQRWFGISGTLALRRISPQLARSPRECHRIIFSVQSWQVNWTLTCPYIIERIKITDFFMLLLQKTMNIEWKLLQYLSRKERSIFLPYNLNAKKIWLLCSVIWNGIWTCSLQR